MDPIQSSISKTVALIRDGAVTPLDLIESTLENIKTQEQLAAFINVLAEPARAAARWSADRLASGKSARPLEAIPIAVKDVFDIAGTETTGGTAPGTFPVPTRTAPVIERLEQAGAIIIGKTNMDELALGVSTDNRHFGRCLNPWNKGFIPGGSSGGSAVAVVANMALGSLGGDSGGSIRIPASLNGLVGIKPTHGVIDRTGIFTATWTLDCCGPLARTVEDCALLNGAIMGLVPRPKPPTKRIGIPRQFYFDAVDSDVAACVEVGVKVLERRGYRIVDVDTPHAQLAVDAGAIISWSEFGVSQAALLRAGEGSKLAPDLRDLLYAASTHLASDYIRAQQARAILMDEHEALWNEVDALVTPTIPVRASAVGQADTLRIASLTRVSCMTGEPALSVPVGFDINNVPVGMQIMGPRLSEQTIFEIAADVERDMVEALNRAPC